MINGNVSHIESINGEYYCLSKAGVRKTVIIGPYIDIKEGFYEVEFELIDLELTNRSSMDIIAIVDVCTEYGEKILSRKAVREFELAEKKSLMVYLEFSLSEACLIELRVHTSGKKDIAIRLRRSLAEKTMDQRDTIFVENFPPNRNHLESIKDNTFISPYSDLDREILLEDGKVPMFWNKSDPAVNDPNMGDSLAPVVVEAMCGLDSSFRKLDHVSSRFISTGTILNWQKAGHVHVWGSGLDPWIDHNGNSTNGKFNPPKSLTMRVHAVRGALTRQHLLKAGIDCPEIYGDPGCLIPKIIAPAEEKKFELGIIPHISDYESEREGADLRKLLERYKIGANENIKIITTRHGTSFEDFSNKIKEITSCKRIISASYHGLIIPLSYGIPSIFFHNNFFDGIFDVDLDDFSFEIDNRVRDFMLGMNYRNIPMYAKHSSKRTDWDDVMNSIDRHVDRFDFNTEAFEAAFPFRRKDADKLWEIPERKNHRIIF